MGIDETLISERGGPAEEKYLDELEEALGHPLPDDFRKFLLEGDGAVLKQPNSIYNTYYFRLGEFFMAGEDGPCEQALIEVYDMYRDRVPPEWLPVLGDAAGNLFCLAVDGEHRGEVWAWDHEFEVKSGPPSLTNMHMLAPTFDEFVEMVKA